MNDDKSKPIVLEREVPLRAWRVSAEVAFATKREWEPAVAGLAVERGAILPDDVARELLGGRAPVAARLVDICVRLGLLEKSGEAWQATPAGRAAAESGRILFPERGTYTLWAARDALLPSPVVAITPWTGEPSAVEEWRGGKGRPIEQLPAWVVEQKSQVLSLLGGRSDAARIDDLGKGKGEAVDDAGSLSMSLTLEPGAARLRATGALDGARIDADCPPPDVPYDEALRALLGQAGLLSRWDGARRCLLLGFDELESDRERATLTRAVRIERPSLPGTGSFRRTELPPVALFPSTPQDAAAWAEWRLLRNLSAYALGPLQARFRDAAAPFGPLAGACPERGELARRVRGAGRPDAAYWYLQAPADWSLDGEAVP